MITILTSTYNRGNMIQNLYQSLCAQTNKNFQWLIIDDGSNDNTKEIIKSFKSNDFIIEYYFKENGGKHTALNYAHPYIKGDWVFVVDSDDILTNDAIYLVYFYIEKYKNNFNIGCLSFQKVDTKGNISSFNKYNELISNAIDYRINQNIKGEQAEIYKSEVFKKFVFPVFKNEKFLEENYLHINAAFITSTVYISKVIYIFEYIENGLTKQGRKLKIKNPKGEMTVYKLYFCDKFRFRQRLKGITLFIIYALFAKKNLREIYKFTGKNILYFVSVLPSILIYFYWRKKYIIWRNVNGE